MNEPRPVDEREVYAALLRVGVRGSIAVLVVTFFLYLGGIVPPRISIQDLPHYWELRASDYLRQLELAKGWSWVPLIVFGDFLNFLGVVMLSALTVGCYIRILPILIARRDVAYVFIVVAEIAILLLAASGLLTAGH